MKSRPTAVAVKTERFTSFWRAFFLAGLLFQAGGHLKENGQDPQGIHGHEQRKEKTQDIGPAHEVPRRKRIGFTNAALELARARSK
jgi:hypothetical protein